MTNEAQRIAIAEACGWKIPDHCRTKRMLAGESAHKARGAPPDFGQDASGVWHDELPDYLSDLNAMHEAENVLTPPQSEKYAEFILDVLTIPSPFIGTARCAYLTGHATADQRAEAFLRTIGKWEGGK